MHGTYVKTGTWGSCYAKCYDVYMGGFMAVFDFSFFYDIYNANH